MSQSGMRPADLDRRGERKSLIALSRIAGIGTTTLSRWYARFGTFANVWTASRAEIREGIGRLDSRVEERILRLQQGGPEPDGEGEIWTITRLDPEYPRRLADLSDPPWVLYGVGDPGVLRDGPALAVVGTRTPTPYGRQMALRWSRLLAARGVVIVSGLARGIDGIAHRGALEAGGRTVAILGGGLGHLYPPEHRGLAAEIARSAGAVLSEYPPDVRPLPGLFPVRNRLISGLADGVLVVEAGEKSGALGTASHALDQGKEVFAVPGPANALSSRGTNRLIQDGAKLVLDAEDLLEEFPHWRLRDAGEDQGEGQAADPGRNKVLQAVEEGCGTVERIVRRTGLSGTAVLEIITFLELEGKIRRGPGGLYERLR
ncbi:MAG: DNA-processing protein DprA [Alicyclobacillaceae bacterium]|nr:DNA-processing protein DprA [Alicyclobacillaceae bacterium]